MLYIIRWQRRWTIEHSWRERCGSSWYVHYFILNLFSSAVDIICYIYWTFSLFLIDSKVPS